MITKFQLFETKNNLHINPSDGGLIYLTHDVTYANAYAIGLKSNAGSGVENIKNGVIFTVYLDNENTPHFGGDIWKNGYEQEIIQDLKTYKNSGELSRTLETMLEYANLENPSLPTINKMIKDPEKNLLQLIQPSDWSSIQEREIGYSEICVKELNWNQIIQINMYENYKLKIIKGGKRINLNNLEPEDYDNVYYHGSPLHHWREKLLKMKGDLFESKIFDFQRRLNESSFFIIDIDDILTDEFMKTFIKDDCVDMYLEDYIERNELNEDDEYEIENSEEFKEYLKDILKENFDDFCNNFRIDNSLTAAGKLKDTIKIYRKMTVDDNWLNHLKTQGKRLGIYWSWDSHSAEAHWGDWDKKNKVTIESEINHNYVNWDDTVYQNIHPNYSEEREIRLFKNTPIYIKSLEYNDEQVDISDIKNKVFYA